MTRQDFSEAAVSERQVINFFWPNLKMDIHNITENITAVSPMDILITGRSLQMEWS